MAITHKSATAARWTFIDPVLREGELGYESDTGNFKIGDGATAWSSLPTYSAGGGGGGTSPSIFQVRKTDSAALDSTTTNPPTAEAIVDWNTTDLIDTGFSYASGELTIGSALNGRKALFHTQVNGDGFSGRTQVVVEIHRDTGSGYSALIRSSNYNSRDVDQNEGATVISGFYDALATGYKYKIMCSNNNDGNVGIYEPTGCFWSVAVL